MRFKWVRYAHKCIFIIIINEGSINIVSRCNELLLVKYIMNLKPIEIFLKGKGGCPFAGSGLSLDMKRMLVAGGSSSQVQINVKCHGWFQRRLLFAGGCSSEVVASADSIVCDSSSHCIITFYLVLHVLFCYWCIPSRHATLKSG